MIEALGNVKFESAQDTKSALTFSLHYIGKKMTFWGNFMVALNIQRVSENAVVKGALCSLP